MNKNKRPAWRWPAAISLIWLTAAAAALILLYRFTRYLPLMLGGLVVLLPTLVYWVLFLFCREGGEETAENADSVESAETVETVENVEAQEPDGDTEAERPRRSRHLPWGGIRRVLGAVGRLLGRLGCAMRRLYYRSRAGAVVVLSLAAMTGVNIFFWLMLRRATTVYTVSFVTPVILAVMFVICIIFEKWCANVATEDTAAVAQLRCLRTALATMRLVLALVTAAAVVKLLGFYELLRPADIALAVIFVYVTVFLTLSLTVCGVRRELLMSPELSIPMPLSLGRDRDLGVLSYLEKNTGITMRSLWSMKLVKKMIPYTVMLSALLLWLCSGVVQVEAYQTGAVYRFGQLREQTLEPGLHLTLPWPIDRVEIYDTGNVSTLTIGYISSEETDNTWTGTHGSNEYRLLLGGGNELVSINLRLEYRISDLESYLRSCSSPERLLEAAAYELVTDRTIGTDLDSLLSTDRAAFADSFRSELTERMAGYSTGLELVSVVLESIHPPIEIASVYQEMVGAEIKADKYILDAEAAAAVKLAEAQKSYDTAVNTANADSYTKTAAAEADVAEFMAGVAADRQYSDSYRYYKYLSAIGSAYGKARLVIVGQDIDSSSIYFGGIAVIN